MDGLEPAEFPDCEIQTMWGVFPEMRDENAICYSFNTYKEKQALSPDSEVPKIAINGIFPDEKTVKNGTYPFISEVRVAIRSDLDKNSMAYKLYKWMQSENAKSTIKECGFITK
jgi:phosphate transport system substrate-binding protein